MRWWLWISFFLEVTSEEWLPNCPATQCQKNSLHGIYYMPSMIGVNPMATFEGPALYDQYFKNIYLRDLSIMGKVSNFIQLPGDGIRKLKETFLDQCTRYRLSVAVTFSFRAYDLIGRFNSQERLHVKNDLIDLIDLIDDHAAVKMWVLGDLYDPVFGERLSEPSSEFVDSYINFVKSLKTILQTRGRRASERVIAMSLYVGTKRGAEYISKFEDKLQDPNQRDERPFDYWIFSLDDLQDVSNDTLKYVVQELEEGNEQPGKTKNGSMPGVIFQFSTSTYNAERLEVAPQKQSRRMEKMLSDINVVKQNQLGGRKVEGIIVREWTDQWWRGDNDVGCNSGLEQPFYQSYCQTGFWGLNSQYNLIGGRHCIQHRPVLDIFGMARYHPEDNTYANVTGEHQCVLIWPTLFWNEVSVLMFIPIGSMAILNLVLWVLWRRARKREKKEINEYLGLHPKGSRIKPGKGKAKGLAEPLLKDHPSEEKKDKITVGPLHIPGCEIPFCLRTTIAPPTTKNLGGDPCGPKTLTELYFKEHIRRQKLNTDALIEHERKVLEALCDLGLIVGLANPQDMYDQAVRNVHCRLLEGYRCWLDKQGQSKEQQNQHLTDRYAETLLYRLMSSIGEHAAHCPERLALIFHRIITEKSNDKGFTIDLDFLHDGLVHGNVSVHEGTINFDDINECGILDKKELKKTWYESLGPAVAFDYLRDYSVIFFFKSWIFAIASIDGYEWDDTIKDFYFPFCHTESGIWVTIEILLFIYAWTYQMRKFPSYRLPGLIFSIIMVAYVWLGIDIIAGKDYQMIKTYCMIYHVIRMLYCMLPHHSWKRCTSKGHVILYDTQMIGKTRNNMADVQTRLNDNPQPEGFDNMRSRVQSWIFWILTMAATYLIDRYLIVNIASSFSLKTLCYRKDVLRCGGAEWADPFQSNICTGCYTSMFLAHGLMFVSFFSETPLIFSGMVSIWGYYKGQGRKIANVFAAESCVVDLTVDGRERKALEEVFGIWENSAFFFWKEAIDELYQRDLISDIDRTILSKPGKKYLFSSINFEARERLSFFLRTIMSMYKAKRRHGVHGEDLRTKLRKMSPSPSVVDEAIKNKKAMETEQRDTRRKMNVFKGCKYIVKDDHEYDKYTGQEDFKQVEEKVENEEEDDFEQYLHDTQRKSIVHQPTKSWTRTVPDCWNLKDSEKKINVYSYTEQKIKSPKNPGKPMHPDDLSENELADWFLRCIPRLSHVITCYSESIMLSREYLQLRNGQLTNLERLIQLSSYSQEWEYMSERFVQKWSLDTERNLLINFLQAIPSAQGFHPIQRALIREVRIWASFRAQTIYRTIRGALTYHKSLKYRMSRFVCKDNPQKTCDLKLHDFTELIVAHQTYGSYPKAGKKKKKDVDGWVSRRQDIEYVLKTHCEFPMLLVYDYSAPPPPSKRKPPDGGNDDFDYYWKVKCEAYWELDEKEMEKYWANRCREYKNFQFGDEINVTRPNFKNATCIKRMVNGKLALVTVMPRMNGLRLGRKAKTQGKAANQVNALRCLSGHVIQVSDANMDGWIGESLKLPHITRQFIDGDPSKKLVGSRTKVLYRIIGFREYIFTGPLGAVAEAMASSEFVFGTLFQRVLTDPLDVRMHYGHPDFFDAFWVLNRGTLSKASPNINLSEDVFSGYNVALRGEKISHSDSLEWQKGRETVFTAASGFLTKISAGSVAIQRTRDMQNMQLGLTFFKKLSLLYGGLFSFILHLLIDWSITLYMSFFLFSSYSNITLADIQGLSSSMGSEWLISLGLVTALGYFVEMILEYGWGSGLARALRIFPTTAIFYVFQNKTMATSLMDSIMTGEAAYVNTGRPNAFDHYSTRTMYRSYALSHYYPALSKFLIFYLYQVFVGETGGALPMILTQLVTFSWIFAPILFCPQISDAEVLMQDLIDVFSFIFSTRDKEDNKHADASLDKFWRVKEYKLHGKDILLTRIVRWLFRLIPFLVIFSVAFSSFVDYACMFLFMLVGHWMLTFTFWFSNYSNVIRAAWMVAPAASVWVVRMLSPHDDAFTTDALMGGLLFLSGLRVLHWLMLIMATLIMRCSGNKCCGPKRYKKFIGNLYFLLLQFHVHFYSAIIVCTAQTLAMFAVMLMWWVYGWVMRFYKWSVVKSASDQLGLSQARVKIV